MLKKDNNKKSYLMSIVEILKGSFFKLKFFWNKGV